jgi:cysteine desulfurase
MHINYIRRINMEKFIYVDNSATTKINSQVLVKMMPYLTDYYGNASTTYNLGKKSKEAVDESRRIIAHILKVNPKEIYFTTSGTQADNLAILGFARANKNRGNHIITSCIEHKAILNSCKELEKEGFDVTYLPVDNYGKIDADILKKEIRKDTILISIMYVNNEIGTIQNIKELASIAKENNIVFHTDAVQAAPHIPLIVDNVDMLSISGHKFGAPKGVGALYIKDGISINNISYGGGQENGLLPGTENVSNIVGIAEAYRLTNKDLPKIQIKERALYNYLLSNLKQIKGFILNGSESDSINSVINFSIENVDMVKLKLYLEMNGIYLSAGSACNSGSTELSHVLKAIGSSNSGLRISINYLNTMYEMNYILEKIKNCVKLFQ